MGGEHIMKYGERKNTDPPTKKTGRQRKNYYHDVIIYFLDMIIYFHGLIIYFHDVKIVFSFSI